MKMILIYTSCNDFQKHVFVHEVPDNTPDGAAQNLTWIAANEQGLRPASEITFYEHEEPAQLILKGLQK